MGKYILIILFLTLGFSYPENELLSVNQDVADPKPIDIEKLDFRDEVFFLKNTNTPYSGSIIEYFVTGVISLEGRVLNGKPEGTFKEYRETGTLMSESNFRGGLLNGISISYHKNGDVFFETFYKNGKEHGISRTFWDGKISSITKFNNGDKIVRQNFNPDEQKVSEIWFEGGVKVREIEFDKGGRKYQEKHFDEDGELVKTLRFYTDGNIMEEIIEEDDEW